jgi:uncharacterized protein
MELFDKYLKVKRSLIKGAGKGLFTTVAIPRGARISEYMGRISSWEDADHAEGTNGYIFYLNRNHVIDARKNKKTLAHFANDSKGLTKLIGQRNNAKYVTSGKRVYIEATRNIQPGEEILVGYGKEYWDTVKKNQEQD